MNESIKWSTNWVMAGVAALAICSLVLSGVVYFSVAQETKKFSVKYDHLLTKFEELLLKNKGKNQEVELFLERLQAGETPDYGSRIAELERKLIEMAKARKAAQAELERQRADKLRAAAEVSIGSQMVHQSDNTASVSPSEDATSQIVPRLHLDIDCRILLGEDREYLFTQYVDGVFIVKPIQEDDSESLKKSKCQESEVRAITELLVQ